MAANTKEKIEEQALLLFSRQGFHETSVSEIARMAKVNEATIFRRYGNKKELYLEVLKKYSSTEDIDLLNVQLSLTMEDLKYDLKVLVDEYIKISFSKIHVLRIFVVGMSQFEELKEFGYLIIPAINEHFKGYLSEMEARRIIKVKDIDVVADMFLSTIMSDITYWTTFEKIEAYEEIITGTIDELWINRIEFFCQEFIEYVK